MELTLEQGTAIEAMQNFLSSPDKDFFLLAGSAGTGKTYCIKHLVDVVRGRLIFTAPTNKATRVLRETLTSDNYKPECRTIFSLLGLRLEANGMVKELAEPEDPVDLTKYRAIIVDEASMINSNLWRYIESAAEEQHIKFIFMGDPAQLPPVGELCSPVWGKCNAVAELKRVMRHDNAILTLAVALRSQVNHPAPQFKRKTEVVGDEGVWDCPASELEKAMLRYAEAGFFSRPNDAKAIAWRNVTVDALNRKIRSKIFDNTEQPWLPEDRIILMEPAKGLDGQPIAVTDDEGTVTRVEVDWHPEHGNFRIWRLSVMTDDNKSITLHVLHEDSAELFEEHLDRLAMEAKSNPRRWKNFWEFKENFHRIRHAYAITAHRAQGSTYNTVFVDWRDILLNRNRSEAFRCLYVACTRPKKRLYLG